MHGTSGCIVDIKVAMQCTLKANASSIILAHNHPSGNRKPGETDKQITHRLKSACTLLDISFLDHLVITPYDGFLSFADECLL